MLAGPVPVLWNGMSHKLIASKEAKDSDSNGPTSLRIEQGMPSWLVRQSFPLLCLPDTGEEYEVSILNVVLPSGHYDKLIPDAPGLFLRRFSRSTAQVTSNAVSHIGLWALPGELSHGLHVFWSLSKLLRRVAQTRPNRAVKLNGNQRPGQDGSRAIRKRHNSSISLLSDEGMIDDLLREEALIRRGYLGFGTPMHPSVYCPIQDVLRRQQSLVSLSTGSSTIGCGSISAGISKIF